MMTETGGKNRAARTKLSRLEKRFWPVLLFVSSAALTRTPFLFFCGTGSLHFEILPSILIQSQVITTTLRKAQPCVVVVGLSKGESISPFFFFRHLLSAAQILSFFFKKSFFLFPFPSSLGDSREPFFF